MLKLRTTHFIRHFHRRQFLFGFPHGTDFRNGVNAGRNVFDQMDFGFPLNHRLRGNTALIIRGRGQTRITDDVTDRIDM
ncbi:hypothetical protein D3C80_1713820 [compost metagenome]